MFEFGEITFKCRRCKRIRKWLNKKISRPPTVLPWQSLREPSRSMLSYFKVNTPMDPEGFIYPIHIVAIRAKDVDLDRKLTILIKNGADIKHKYGSNGLTGKALSCWKWAVKKTVQSPSTQKPYNVFKILQPVRLGNFWDRFTGKLINQRIMSTYSVFKKTGRHLDRFTGKLIQKKTFSRK